MKERSLEHDALSVDKNGLNVKIKSHILADELMRSIGFTDFDKNNWYYNRIVPFNGKRFRGIEISFNVTIPKNGQRVRIDILDEDFLQPYDYQSISNEVAGIVNDFVEDQMDYLQKSGVISGHIRGEYI